MPYRVGRRSRIRLPVMCLLLGILVYVVPALPAGATPGHHLSPKVAVLCIQSRTVPVGVARRVTAVLREGIQTMLQPGDPGGVVYIRAATYSPSGALQTIIVPSVPRAPVDNCGVFDARCKAKYRAAKGLFDRRDIAAQSEIHVELAHLTFLHMPAGFRAPDDLYGCLQKAQELLGMRYNRYLVIVGSFDQAPPVRQDLNMRDADLDVIYWCTKAANTCRRQRALWAHYFRTNHVKDQAWSDPSQPFTLLGR